MRLKDVSQLKDPRRLWQRVVLYSKLVVPKLRWQNVGDFPSLWAKAQTRTLVDEPRAHMLWQLARHAACLEGNFAEIGVFRGGTAHILGHICDDRKRELHLFDTFAGMPETDVEKDLLGQGDFANTSLESVKAFLASHRSPIFHQGFFPETAQGLGDMKFSFVHIDVDIASSVQACCEYFYPRMTKGGVIIFDDYGFTSTPGAKLMADAFFRDKPEPVLHLVTSQALVLKQ